MNSCGSHQTLRLDISKALAFRINQFFDIMTSWTLFCVVLMVLGTTAQSDVEVSDNSVVVLCNSTFTEANGVSHVQSTLHKTKSLSPERLVFSR